MNFDQNDHSSICIILVLSISKSKVWFSRPTYCQKRNLNFEMTLPHHILEMTSWRAKTSTSSTKLKKGLNFSMTMKVSPLESLHASNSSVRIHLKRPQRRDHPSNLFSGNKILVKPAPKSRSWASYQTLQPLKTPEQNRDKRWREKIFRSREF